MRVCYGGVVAVDGVDIDVKRKTIVGLIGPNGAGKTTLLDAISGFAPYEGRMTLEGRDLTALPPHRRVRAGLGRTFQQTQLYEDPRSGRTSWSGLPRPAGANREPWTRSSSCSTSPTSPTGRSASYPRGAARWSRSPVPHR